MDKEFRSKQQPGQVACILLSSSDTVVLVQCVVRWLTFLKDERSSYDSRIHIERIYKNPTFWAEAVKKAQHFFTIYLLPELTGQRSKVQVTTIT